MDPALRRLPARRAHLAARGRRARSRCPRSSTPCPYRKGDGTAAGDAAWNRYFAGHGYAGVRIDLRGSGDADGLIDDEYSDQEARGRRRGRSPGSPSSRGARGAVGMIGVSWGGFAALQAAARNPPALRGIVPIHASDDRYADDVHYFGGCVLATDMVHWSTCMAAYVGPAAGPRRRGGGLARRVARAGRADGAVGRDLARPPAPRRLLAPGLGLRALRRHRVPGVRGRRLVGRLPRHGAAHGRARPARRCAG